MRGLVSTFVVLAIGVGGCVNGKDIRASLGVPEPVAYEEVADLNAVNKDLDEMAKALRAFDLTQATDSSSAIAIAGSPVTRSIGGYQFTFTATGTNYSQLLDAYVGGRRNQIDGLCGVFFTGLEDVANGTKWSQDQTNILLDLTSLTLGLTGAATKQLALLAGARVAINDSFGAANSALMLTPDPHAVQRLVRQEQAAVLERYSIARIHRFADAEAFVRAYSHPCTLNGVRELIQKALRSEADRADPIASRGDLELSMLPIVQLLNDGVSETDQISRIAREDAADLYVLYVKLPMPSESAQALTEEQDRIVKRLDPRVSKLTQRNLLSASSKRREIGEHLTQLGVRFPIVASEADRIQTDYAEVLRLREQLAAATSAQQTQPPPAPTPTPVQQLSPQLPVGGGATEQPSTQSPQEPEGTVAPPSAPS